MDREPIDLEALDRFVRGEGTPDERRALSEWVAADPRRSALSGAMRRIGSEPGAPAPTWDVKGAWRRMEPAVTRSARPALSRLAPAPGHSRGFHLLRALAGAVAAVVTVSLIMRPRMEAARPAATAPVHTAREVVTSAGERSTLTLSDGSRIVVSAASRLKIPGDLGRGGRREVWLDGEAFFNIVHDSTRPFVVYTPQGAAEDLGTEFVVSTYPEVRGMRLAVREGRVALHAAPAAESAGLPRGNDDTLAVLGPGDVARMSRAGALRVARRQDVGGLFAASEGMLSLQSTPLREAIPRLERWFDITVRVRSPDLLARRISGLFRGETAATALGVIGSALEARVTWKGREVTLIADHERGEDQ